jgi:hypothetical protein
MPQATERASENPPKSSETSDLKERHTAGNLHLRA